MKGTPKSTKLEKNFYKRKVLIVAKELLGKIFVHKNTGKIYAGKIVEVEAYDGSLDKAAHSYSGKTKRNEIMFREGGYLYVYLSYGVHYCCNVVTGEKDKGTAVLIRAVEPVEGIDRMIKNRFGRNLTGEKENYNLTSGPGKVCKAMDINIKHSGIDLTGDEIYILDRPKIKNKMVGVSKRIGITRSANLPWRFFIKDNPYLSK
ncbi:3-methyladenine DNA glycosylase [bacterium BMS3Abin03]|nr:3-methyladenine DNA glycosylase [bacterium BMS3Abin03]